MMNTPDCRIADPALTFQRQGRHAGFRLTGQINNQKPCVKGEGKACSLNRCCGNQGSMLPTLAALKGFARAAFQREVPDTSTLVAVETLRPARCFQRLGKLLLCAKTLQAIAKRQAFMKLHTIHRDGTPQVHRNQWSISELGAV